MSVYRPTYRNPKTGELKQSKVWWFNFTFGGRRIQMSSKSTRKTIAIEAEKRQRLDLERSHAGLPVEKPSQRIRTVAAVLFEYAGGYAVNHRTSSVTMVKNRGAHLVRILGSLPLSELDEQRIVAYMQKRQAEPDAGGRTINLEIQILANALGRTWKYLWPRVKKLEENHDVGKALEPAEEQRLMEIAALNQSRLIYPFLNVLAWTGTRSDEARTLRWNQVDFAGAGEITVGVSKTAAGKGRRIPMISNLKLVLSQHASWYASKVGPIQPDWYVFPLMNRLAIHNPSKPVTSLKTAWESVRAAAGISCRLHDLRHTFCTKLGEAGVPERTMLDMMGHVSQAMLSRYSHIRVKARRDAMDALELRHFPISPAKEVAKVGVSGKAKTAVTH